MEGGVEAGDGGKREERTDTRRVFRATGQVGMEDWSHAIPINYPQRRSKCEEQKLPLPTPDPYLII